MSTSYLNFCKCYFINFICGSNNNPKEIKKSIIQRSNKHQAVLVVFLFFFYNAYKASKASVQIKKTGLDNKHYARFHRESNPELLL